MDGFDVLVSILWFDRWGIRGRTAVQKLAYFASCKFSGIDVPQYEPGYFGPHSAGLEQMLARLMSFGFVNENLVAGGYARYAYALSEDGLKMHDDAKSRHEKEFADMRKLVSDCKQECDLDIPVMSAASKIHYMVEKDGMATDDAARYVRGLKWITDDQDARGIRLLSKLGLALPAQGA